MGTPTTQSQAHRRYVMVSSRALLNHLPHCRLTLGRPAAPVPPRPEGSARLVRPHLLTAPARPTANSESRTAMPGLTLARPRRYVRRDLWRNKAIEIRAQFERNRNVRDPRAVAALLTEAEREVQKVSHPDPYRRELLVLPVLSVRSAVRLGPTYIFSFAHICALST